MAEPALCPCGRYVRMVNTDERNSYTPGKKPKREGRYAPPSMHVFVTRPAFDGLCSKCAVIGVPDYKYISPNGSQEKYKHNKITHSRRALGDLGL